MKLNHVGIYAYAVFIASTLSYANDLTLTNLQPFPNSNGAAATFAVGTAPQSMVNTSGSFFKNFGTNKRTCFSCHVAEASWTITPEFAKKTFELTQGTGPLFRTNDGSNAPELDVSTLEAKRKSYSMLLNRGLIRVGLPIPNNAEFKLTGVEDPYGHANAEDLSLFRRPLPSQNLKFLSDVMWDGRETIEHVDLETLLGNQANNATKTHASTLGDLEVGDQNSMVQFELSLLFGQISTPSAGTLNANGALGGPEELDKVGFYLGINDPLGKDPKGVAFNSTAFTLFNAWKENALGTLTDGQKAVARGEALFNSKLFHIKAVTGLNDVANQSDIQGTCTTCHNTPNAGSNSSAMRMNIGISDGSLRTADLPLYTFTNLQTGEILKSTDPGRALISGKWSEIGNFKIPTLRGLSARAPYFHNGAAATLSEVVEYHNARFQIQLSSSEKRDLVEFLKAL